MLKVIIPAAGRGSRWKNFRGTPKHLTAVDGEILIHRTIKQISRYTDNITVIAKDPSNISVAVEYPQEGEWNDGAKLWSSNYLWSKDHRNIILFGDVWFSEEAIETIINDKGDISFFMRTGPSKITGKNHKEIFAIAINGEKIEAVRNLLFEVIQENKNGPGAYLLYKKINNLDNISASHHFDNKNSYVEINDWTDDFDYPKDLIRWEKRRLKFGGK